MIWMSALVISLFGISSTSCKQQPHLILIVADDLGWNDVSWHNPGAVTPHLEELARGGVILNQSYVLPICTPTRSALMTGRYPFTIGRQRSTIRPSEPTGLLLNATLLPQSLQKVGYSTHAVGKWHLGFCSWSYTPTYRGFDTFYGYYNGAEDYFTHLRNCLHEDDCNNCSSNQSSEGVPSGKVHFGLDLRNNTTPDPSKEGIYSSHLFASYVEDLLESRNPEKPMFLYLPFQNVHAPLMVPVNYTKPFKHIRDHNRRIYLGMVSALDEAVGRVVKALKASGHYNNSVIVFTTDNGGTCHHGGNNWPLRGMKATYWEGGTRGVAFVHSPLLPNPGTVSNKLVHATDWYRTFVNLGGGVSPADIDGYDQWEAISSPSPSPRKRMVYNIDNTDRFKAAVRIGDYKLLVGNPGESDWTPPPEMVDLAKKAKEVTSAAFASSESMELEENSSFQSTQHEQLENVFNLQSNQQLPVLNESQSDFISESTNLLLHNALLKRKVSAKKQKHSHESYMKVLKQEKDPFVLLNESLDSPLNTSEINTDGNEVQSALKFSDDLQALAERLRIKSDIGKSSAARKHLNVYEISKHRQRKKNPPKSKAGETASVSWQYLLKMNLVNDTWLKQFNHTLDYLKNDTEIWLYNITADPEERNNIAEEEINTAKTLLEFLLGELMNRYVPADVPDEVPEANPKYWNNTWSPGWCKTKSKNK